MSAFERPQSAVPTPRVSETPKPRAGRSKYGNLSAQKFQIAHQQVNLDVDFYNKKATGYTELSVVPLSTSLRTIRLDARTMNIKKVLVNGREVADYVHKDILYINDPDTFEECAKSRIPNILDEYSSEFTIYQHHLLRQKLSYIFGHLDDDQNSVAEKGENLNTEELTILLPDDLKLELTDASALTQTPNSVAPATSQTPMHLRLKNAGSEVYNPIRIGIEYEIINPKDGLNFVSGPGMDKHMWHVYTSNAEHNVSASSWVPCVDNLLERSSWSIELSIPRSVRDISENDPRSTSELEGQDPGQDSDSITESNGKSASVPDLNANEMKEEDFDDDEERENYDLFVCSGDFNNTKEAPHPSDISKKIVSWSVFNPVCAHHIGWAVGAFQRFELSDFSDGTTQLAESEDEFEAMEKDETSSSVSLYYLPGQEELVKNTCIFAQKAIEFFSREFGSYPFSSYGIAFVEDARYPRNNFAGLSLLSTEMLYPATLIEPMFATTEDILECIAGQWSGISIVPLTFNDFWCTIGIAKFMTFQFMKTLVGSNEHRYQIKKKMSAIIEQDVGQRPLGLQALQAPISESSLDFIRLKAPIILFILDRRMTKTDKSFGFTRVLPKLFLQAMSGDLQNGALSTSHFQYVCEKVNRNRLESFFKQWVYGTGTPIFNITQKFNKKRSLIEVVIRQSQLQQAKTPHPKSETFIKDAVSYLNQEQNFPVQQTFLGPMTIRVHEADGTPYEHIVDIKDKVVKFDVQYNTKYKRLKKSKEENGEGGSIFSKLGDVLQDEKDVKIWHLEDWPKRDEEFLDPFEWLRVDTDFEWVATFNLKQADYMFGSQLQQDRDIEAQIAACEFFGVQEKTNSIHCTMLTRTLIDERYFYGVRIAAAKALADVSSSSNHYMGLNYLVQAFKALFCFEHSSIPKSNNFQDFGEFFVQEAMPEIMAGVKDENGSSPAKVKALLYNLLKYNDNSSNDFEDCFYVASLVRALVRSVIPVNEDGSRMETGDVRNLTLEHESKDRKFVKKVIEEIERSQKLDAWVPSYQFIVSRTCLEEKILMARSDLCPLAFEELLHLTHSKYSNKQRVLAFEGLFLLGGLKNAEVLNYFTRVCLLESFSSSLKSDLISVLIKAISEAATQGLASTLDDPEFEHSGEESKDKGNTMGKSNMVVVEESQTSEMNVRRDAFARATVKGAIELLRRDLAVGVGLQNTLWSLLHSSLLCLNDRKMVFVLCDILYKATSSFSITIPVPCVPFDELKKKIVAKLSGDGMVTIMREARFKIQLSTKANIPEIKPRRSDLIERVEDKQEEPEKAILVKEAPPPPPKLKLKISNSSVLRAKEETKPQNEVESPSLVTRSASNSMQLRIKLSKARLRALESVEMPVKTPVTTDKTTAKTTVNTSVKTPVKTPAKSHVGSPAKSPVESPVESPVKSPTKIPVKSPMRMPVKSPMKIPVKRLMKIPVKTPENAAAKAAIKTAVKIPEKTALKPTVSEPLKIPSAAYYDGTFVRIIFRKPEIQKKLSEIDAPKGRLRFVRIFTKDRRVELSEVPFPESEPKVKSKKNTNSYIDKHEEPNQKVLEPLPKSDSNRSPKESLRVSSTVAHAAKITKGNGTEDLGPKLGPEKVEKSSKMFEKPYPFKRSSSEEPERARPARPASPFSKESSPGVGTKRKKTRIYIHGKSYNTTSSRGTTKDSETIQRISEQNGHDLGGPEKEATSEDPPAVVSKERGVSDDPADEPKRKLKLKLSFGKT